MVSYCKPIHSNKTLSSFLSKWSIYNSPTVILDIVNGTEILSSGIEIDKQLHYPRVHSLLYLGRAEVLVWHITPNSSFKYSWKVRFQRSGHHGLYGAVPQSLLSHLFARKWLGRQSCLQSLRPAFRERYEASPKCQACATCRRVHTGLSSLLFLGLELADLTAHVRAT